MQSVSTQSIFKIIPGAASEWATATFSNTVTDAKYMPPNVLLFETDTRRLKVSDGVATSYTALPYLVDATFTTAIKEMIDKAGLSNGVLTLDDVGGIGGQYIPSYIAQDPIIVRDISARDAIATEDRTNIVVVRNASADSTVGINPENAATKLLLHYDQSLNDSSTYSKSPVVLYDGGGTRFTATSKFGSGALVSNRDFISAYEIDPIPAGHAFTVEFMYQRPVNAPTPTASSEYISSLHYMLPSGESLYHIVRIGILLNTQTLFIQGMLPNTTSIVDTVSINDGLMHRVAVRHTGTTISLYVDDRLVGSRAHAYTYPVNVISIGGSAAASGSVLRPASTTLYKFTGVLDEYRIVNYDKFSSDTSIPTAPFAVNDNAASYIWDDTSGTWLKISEYASMDVDFTDYVTQGDALTRLSDGSTFVRFTVTERSDIEQLDHDLASLISLESNNYAFMGSRFDTISVNQDAVATRLSDLESAILDQTNHVLRDDEVVYFMSAPVSRFQ